MPGRDSQRPNLFAEDGLTALAWYKKRRFDLVVTDLVMPRLNGLRLIKEIMEEAPYEGRF